MKKFWPILKKTLFELLIVFAGVFLAFQLSDYQQTIADRKIKERYFQLILVEFQNNLQEVKYAKNAISSQLDSLINEINSGKKPGLVELQNFILDNNLLVIKAAFESGYLENLDPRFVTNLSRGSNYLTRLSKYFDHFNNKVLLAHQMNGWQKDKFYGDQGNLRPEFDWYLKDLRFILDFLTQLEGALEQGAIPDIQQIMETGI